MTQINIPFDSIDYTINQESLTPFVSELSTHMSNEMKGSGATVQFNGTSYNIDAAKLSSLKSAFISYLGAIAGSGHKVIIDGVQHGIDSSKLSDAIEEIHVVLRGLQNPGSGDEPEEPSDKELSEQDLIDFEYVKNDDGTYTLTAWKGTLNGQPSTEMVFPDSNKIIM